MNGFEIYVLFGSPLVLLGVGVAVGVYIATRGSGKPDLPAGE